MSAENTLFVDVIFLVSNDGSDSSRNSTHCGTCVRYPTLGRKVGNVGGRGGLGGARNGFEHGGR